MFSTREKIDPSNQRPQQCVSFAKFPAVLQVHVLPLLRELLCTQGKEFKETF